jgi:hypothetical protein
MKILLGYFYFIIFCLLCTGYLSAADTPSKTNWTEINSTAGFSPRSFQTATVFNDQIWLIGGIANEYKFNETALNDIWSSHDGNNWTLVTEHADFSPRYGHGTVAFHGKLWVIGGRQNFTLMNDIWSSDNGQNWTLITEHAGFSPRFFHSVAVFNDSIWVIGGGLGNSNDIWSSKDGKTWTLVNGQADFTPRHGQGIAVLDDQLWIVGGEYSDSLSHDWIVGGWSNEVWSSSNGVTWTMVNGKAPFERLEFRPVAVYDNKMWLSAGGRDVSEYDPEKYAQTYAYNTVWSSSDGINWTLESNNPGFSPRYGHSFTEFGNKLWIIGGYDPSDNQVKNDVWSYQPISVNLSVNKQTTMHSVTLNPTILNTTSPSPTTTNINAITVILSVLLIPGTWLFQRENKKRR